MNLANIYLESARRHPGRLAVSAPDGNWTYAEVNESARRLARVLASHGVGPGHRVGFLHPKGGRVVAAMQAVLRLGAAYVPLDPGSPVERIDKILADCALTVLLTDEARSASLEETHGAVVLTLEGDSTRPCFEDLGDDAVRPEDSPRAREPSDLAYILYTSGSTGTPKGVCLSHENALAFIEWAAHDVKAGMEDRFSNHAPFHFDLSVFDLYVPATVGASVAIVPEGISYMPRRLVRFLQDHRISVWYSVPSALIMMMDHGQLDRLDPERHPRVVVFAGEPFPIRHLRRLREALPHARLLNYYGPTETNVCTSFEVTTIPDAATSIPIGRAASWDRVWAMRPDGALAGPGEEGELWVDGPTVMLGYWGRPRWQGPYPTGDIVHVQPNGVYSYVGRRDHMVKVRGHRIELGEIEAALEQAPAVHRAAALVVGSGIEARIVVFLTGTSEEKATLLQLKESSARLLPRYMIPDQVVWVDELPRTPNGKLDRRALARSLDGTDSEEHNAA